MPAPADVKSGFTVAVERTCIAPADIVWAALTRPECLDVWFVQGTEVDLRVGGRYRNQDGDTGEFREVVPLQRLVMTWENPDTSPGSVVTYTLERLDEGTTKVRIEHTGIASDRDHVELARGWSWASDSLDSFLKTGAGLPYEPWLELQTELHRRAQEKSAAEAEAERRAAGVVLHDIPVPAKRKGVERGERGKQGKRGKKIAKDKIRKSPSARKDAGRGRKRG